MSENDLITPHTDMIWTFAFLSVEISFCGTFFLVSSACQSGMQLCFEGEFVGCKGECSPTSGGDLWLNGIK